MSRRRALVRLTEPRLAEIRSAELGVVVLTLSMCGQSHVYQADIERLMDQGAFDGIPFGKLVTDEPGSVAFLEANSWAQDVSIFPVTIIYQRGTEIARFSTSRACTLQRYIVAVSGHAVQGGHSNEPDRDGSRDLTPAFGQPTPETKWHFSAGFSGA